MATHLIQDLPLALIQVGLQDSQRSRIHDFHQMNDLLGESVDAIQDRVSRRYSPYLHWLDRLAKHEDEILTNYGFRLSRGMAWYNAMRLLDPASEAEARESISKSSEVFIERVLHPPMGGRIVLRAMRFLTGRLRRWPAPASSY